MICNYKKIFNVFSSFSNYIITRAEPNISTDTIPTQATFDSHDTGKYILFDLMYVCGRYFYLIKAIGHSNMCFELIYRA